MKKIKLILSQLLLGITMVNAQNTFPASGSVGIGTTSPAGSALLEVKSTTKGVLFPRMTKAQRDAINSPATGLIIYQTDNTAGLYYYNGSIWAIARGADANKTLSNLNAPTAINVELLPGSDDARNIGSAAKSWKDLYMDGELYMQGTRLISSPISTSFYVGPNAGNLTTIGIDNTGIGAYTLGFITSGAYNTALGSFALRNTNTGSNNIGCGYVSLYSNSNGYENVAYGNYSLYNNTSGYYNTALGHAALLQNTTGTANVAVGENALYSNTTGHYNTAIGKDAFFWNTDAQYNTALGYGAGNNYLYGWNNTLIGSETDANGSGYYNSIALGNIATITNVNQARIGNSFTSSIGGYANWTNISDGRIKKNVKEDVKGLEFINKLRPVTYNLDVTDISARLNEGRGHELNQYMKTSIAEKEKVIFSGFIAQEVEQAAESTGYDFSGVDKPQNDNSLYGLRYAEFVVPLVKAVQELNEQLKTQNDELKSEIEALKSVLTTDQMQKLSQTKAEGEARLEQNTPNPFSEKTVIRFYIPESAVNAAIKIYSATGAEIKSIAISTKGDGQVEINAKTIAPGTYNYSLIVDGKVASTKQVVISK